MKFKYSAIFMIIFLSSVFASEVIRYSGAAASLQQEWEWAGKQAASLKSGYWIGYTIPQPADGETFVEGSVHHYVQHRLSLQAILSGDSASAKQVSRDIALLFHIASGKPEFNHVDKLKVANLFSEVDLHGQPLFWLGETNPRESAAFLEENYDAGQTPDVKEHLITAIALHKTVESTLPFLEKIIQSSEPEDIRENAVFWTGQQNSPAALKVLEQTLDSNPSLSIAKKAVFAISQVDGNAAEDALIDIAKKDKRNKIRKEAIFWLGQKASDKVAETLKNMVYQAGETEVQEAAVFAISQLHDGEGVPVLIEIARTHPSLDVRKKAIFWLGQSGDPRAVDALAELVKSH